MLDWIGLCVGVVRCLGYSEVGVVLGVRVCCYGVVLGKNNFMGGLVSLAETRGRMSRYKPF